MMVVIQQDAGIHLLVYTVSRHRSKHYFCIKDGINTPLNLQRTRFRYDGFSVTHGFKWFLSANGNVGANGEMEEDAEADRKVMTTMNARYIFWNNKKINPQQRSDSFYQESQYHRLQRP
jgi:hypothetical protein